MLGTGPATKWDNFLEKLCCKFFRIDVVAFMQGGMMARKYEMHAHTFSKVCLVLIFLNTIVEKNIP